VAAVPVPSAFPRQVRNDPVGHINLHFLARTGLPFRQQQ
jgi:hypothetical protein